MPVPVKHKAKTSPKWAFCEWFDIPTATDIRYVYLRRFRFIGTPYFSINVHFIFEPDDDQDPHDHPWNFWSLVWRGGYSEDVYPSTDGTRSVRHPFAFFTKHHGRFSLHRMTTEYAHKITDLKPGTATVLLLGKRQREWGFWTSEGWVPWRPYVEQKYGKGHPQVSELS